MIRPGPPTELELDALVRDMRGADVAECLAAGQSPRFALTESARLSAMCWTAFDDAGPLCAFGAVRFGMAGAPWLLGTDRLHSHRRSLMRLAPSYIAAMRKQFAYLVNFAHADNGDAVRWLRRIGFVVEPAAPHWSSGEPFRRFTLGLGDARGWITGGQHV